MFVQGQFFRLPFLTVAHIPQCANQVRLRRRPQQQLLLLLLPTCDVFIAAAATTTTAAATAKTAAAAGQRRRRRRRCCCCCCPPVMYLSPPQVLAGTASAVHVRCHRAGFQNNPDSSKFIIFQLRLRLAFGYGNHFTCLAFHTL